MKWHFMMAGRRETEKNIILFKGGPWERWASGFKRLPRATGVVGMTSR